MHFPGFANALPIELRGILVAFIKQLPFYKEKKFCASNFFSIDFSSFKIYLENSFRIIKFNGIK